MRWSSVAGRFESNVARIVEADGVGPGTDGRDRQRITVGVGVVGEHVDHDDVAAGDDRVTVVGGRRRTVLAVGRQHSDHDLADRPLAVGVDDRVPQPVGSALRRARLVAHAAVGLRGGDAERRLGGDRLELDRVTVGVGVVGEHRDVDGAAGHRARHVGPGDRWTVRLTVGNEAHLHEAAALVPALVGDVVAERERRGDAGVDRHEDLLPAGPDAQVGARHAATR